MNDRFWAKVLFKEFIRHYRKLDDAQIVADVRKSMDDLEDLVDDADSFGSKMVRWSMERADQPFATAARENGKKGGRPRKNSVEDGARRTGADSLRSDCHSAPVRSLPMPTTEQLYDFARLENLDEADARDWYEMTVVDRSGNDREGKPITNWKAALKRFCKSRADRRTA